MKKTPSTALVTRRQFIGRTGAAVAAFTIVPRHVLGGPGFVPPSEKVNIAIIGCGGQGRTNVRALFNQPDAQIIAIADVAERTDLEKYYYKGFGGRLPVKAEIDAHYAETTPGFACAAYEDFRVMLENEKAIDAVLCATPDHLHAYVSIVAMRQGKHMFCEKPLTHNVAEARAVARVAAETGVATQMGNYGHSGEGIRRTVEWLQAGAIGAVREVHAWSHNSHAPDRVGRPPEEPVPAGLNWDLWLGPREVRPYSSNYAPVNWRDYWAFGTGTLGDMACHNLDPAFWALDLAAPLTIEASCTRGKVLDPEVVPLAGIYRYTYGPRGDLPPLVVTWYDGGLMPATPPELEPDRTLGQSGNGILFIGDKGKITCAGWGGAPRFIPHERLATYEQPPKTLPRGHGHHRDWLDACKGGAPASANFEYGARLTEVVLLGVVALRCGKLLHWDAAAMKATNAPEADAFLQEPYRAGWELPA